MSDLLQRLGMRHPIIQAPMGGGPGTPALAAAVANAGGLGSLAGAYLTPAQIRAEYEEARRLTGGPLNLNLFAGGYHTTTEKDGAPILQILDGIHRELQLPPPAIPNVPPDPFLAQAEVILELKPRVFSFTFGIPARDVLEQFRAAGIFTIGTATTVDEGVAVADGGADAVVAQGAEAGAHRGTFAVPFEDALVPTLDLVRALTLRVSIPVIASGGIMTGSEIATALRAGAAAVQLGTAFLACPEAGTPSAYRTALLDTANADTVITRAFSGRAARGIRNRFIDLVGERDDAILPFPIQNTLTRPMRGAAAKAGKADYLSLWAGSGLRKIRVMPAADLMAVLMEEMTRAEATQS